MGNKKHEVTQLCKKLHGNVTIILPLYAYVKLYTDVQLRKLGRDVKKS